MKSVIHWLRRERSSTRLAFLLQVFSRVATSIMALVWTRLLLHAMGKPLNGIWLSFQAVALLGGLGDLGLGGAVGMRVSRYLGQKDEAALEHFLATARALFLALGLLVSLAFLVLSPWMSTLLGFESLPEAGSMTLLFVFAAIGFAILIVSSYIANVSYACGNMMWPIVPAFLLMQASLATHWWLARKQAPLWMQYCPYLVCAASMVLLTWRFVRISDPATARILPLKFCWSEWRSLTGDSFWLYFWSLGSVVYMATDRLVLQKGFGSEIVPTYYNNYKVSELLLSLIVAATFASMPKIARWLASGDDKERTRGIQEILRLHRIEVALTCGCALGYLACNDDFVRFWLGRDLQAPIVWQFAFALSLVITGCADAAVQTAPRCCPRGLRISGVAVATTALINVTLSVVAMKRGSILGIALATVVAQSFFSLWLSRFLCRELNLSWPRWIWRGWLAPVMIIGCAFAARVLLPFDSMRNVLLLAGAYLLLFLAALAAAGITADLLRHEWAMMQAVFRSRK